MVTISSGSLSSGSSIATGYSIPQGMSVTRADIAGPSSMYKLKTVEQTSTTGNYYFPSDIGQHYMTIAVSAGTRKTSLGGGTKFGSIQFASKDIIRLPLPENIKDVNEVDYTPEGVISMSSTVGALAGTLNPQGLLRNLIDTASKQGVGAELRARSGTAPNQMLTILLKGPKYKTHSFSWKLYPRDMKESDTIRKIIQTLKSSSRPGLSAAGWFFTFPHIFKLSFTTNGSVNNENNAGYLFEFKPAVLQSVVVNYTPSGQPSLYRNTGAPDGVELSLSFTELEYWLGDERVTEYGLFGDTAAEFGIDLNNLFGFTDPN
jgi:hypothetical protein